MEAFMVDLCNVHIERDEFEIAQRDRPFRLLQPPRVRTLALFEKIREGSNFWFDVARGREIVSGDKSREMQEKLTAQGQRIYGSLTRVQKDAVLMGTNKREQVVDGVWSFDFCKFWIGRLEIKWLV